ncbi:MAG: hypothetical protein JO007_19505 [Alphaproteobacteria bacterium]|nr:hypothetical protein [Alphaproteobacteria bacterium]
MLAELPAWQLLVLAAATGLLWATSLFDWSFVAVRHAFWQFPMGIDMQQVLAAYYYYVQSPWQLPLFYVSALGAPTGTNIIFTDAVPIAALAGKLIHSLIGVIINPYGAFLLLCFILPGVAMTFVLIATRTRYALAAVTGAIFADAMPALLWRWGDIALEAQFLLIGALALYLFSLRARCWRGLAAGWIGYLALTYLTNIYLFAMVGAVWLCAVVQREFAGLTTMREALATRALTVAAIAVVIALGGQFGAGGALPFAEYGHYSMNLLSPFVPQGGGVFYGMAGIIDTTGGQYEGFNYLGLGLLVASVFVLPTEVGWLRHNARRHTALLIACAALTAVAVSHRVFLGHWLILTLPMPDPLNHLFGIFRSSGRFFWLIGYAQIAVVVVLAYRRPRPGMALCLFGAALLQICDVRPLHDHIVDTIAAGRGAEELDHNEVARLVAGAGMIEVAPSFQCSASIKQISANVQLMLAAARADVPTNTVYMARQSYGLGWWDVLRRPARGAEMFEEHRSQYCQREIEQVRNGGRPDDVFVLLSDRPRLEQIAPGVTCSRLSWARYCQAHGNDQAGQQ